MRKGVQRLLSLLPSRTGGFHVSVTRTRLSAHQLVALSQFRKLPFHRYVSTLYHIQGFFHVRILGMNVDASKFIGSEDDNDGRTEGKDDAR